MKRLATAGWCGYDSAWCNSNCAYTYSGSWTPCRQPGAACTYPQQSYQGTCVTPVLGAANGRVQAPFHYICDNDEAQDYVMQCPDGQRIHVFEAR